MGEAAQEQAPKLGNLLETSDDRYVQEAAAEALGAMGEADQAPKLGNLLETSDDTGVQEVATEALEAIGEVNTETIISVLNAIYGNHQSQTSSYRFLAYFLSGGKADSIIAIQWLGLPKEYPDLRQLIAKKQEKYWRFLTKSGNSTNLPLDCVMI
jgi:HEAT repeat protein